MKNKLLKYAAIFFIAHLLLQMASLFIGFGVGMSYFEQGKSSFLSRNAIIPFQILSFPLLTLLSHIEFFQNNPEGIPGVIIFPLNSLVWTLVFYGIMKWKVGKKK